MQYKHQLSMWQTWGTTQLRRTRRARGGAAKHVGNGARNNVEVAVPSAPPMLAFTARVSTLMDAPSESSVIGTAVQTSRRLVWFSRGSPPAAGISQTQGPVGGCLKT